MFEGKTLWQIIEIGGITMYVLIACSIISLGVLIERLVYYQRRSSIKRPQFMNAVRKELKGGNLEGAVQLCKSFDTPFTRFAHAGINCYGHNERTILEAMEREITIETIKLERFTGIVATIGSTAVYIGLLGTVIGIMKAFHNISTGGPTGMQTVIGGIPEALVCTASGLFVAIPSVMGYNFFIRKIDNFVVNMKLCASELFDLLYVDAQ